MPYTELFGQTFLFDECDAELIASHSWWVTNGYAHTKIRREDGSMRSISMHRLILGDPPTPEIDHINRRRYDNRRCNIRPCTRSENARNVPTREGKSSKYRGVSLNCRSGKWQVVLRIGGKAKWCGSYATEDEAWEVAKPHYAGIAP